MAGSCPNKQSPEWKALVESVGSNNAMKLFISNNDSIVSPEVGSFQLFAEANPADSSKLLTKYLSREAMRTIKMDTTLDQLINIADKEIFMDHEFIKWNKLNSTAKSNEITQDSLEQEETQIVPEINMMNPVTNVAEVQNKGRATEIIYKMAATMAAQMSKQTGIAYEMVDADQAADILSESSTPYNNQPGFFYNGKAYFVNDRVTLDTVFHEFSHPVVATLRVSNPEVFNKLYDELAATPEGVELINIVDDKYDNLIEGTDLFKEEVLVHALAKDAANNRSAEKIIAKATPQFSSAIKELLYHIKQLLRKLFGKIKIENLTSNTTLDQLADMLTNSNFKINLEKISDSDVAMFAAAEKAYVDGLVKDIEKAKSQANLQKIINSLSIVITTQEKRLSRFGFKEVKAVLGTEEGGLLREAKLKIAKAQSKGLSEEQQLAHATLTTAQQATSLINSLATLKVAADKLSTELVNILHTDTSKMSAEEASTHTINSLNQAQYYGDLLNEWQHYIKITKDEMDAAKIDDHNPIYEFVGTIETKIRHGLEKYTELQQKGAIEVTTEWLGSYKEIIDAKYIKRIKFLEDKLAKSPDNKTIKDELTRAKDELKKFSISKEKVADLYKGKLGDVNWWSSMFEAYSNNPDPIIGSFATFLKNNISRIQDTAIRKEKALKDDIQPLLTKLGITGGNLKETWKFALHKDESFGYDSDGNLIKKDVVSFISSTKNGRYKLKKLEVDIEKAKRNIKELADRNEDTKAAKDDLRAAYKNLNDEKLKYWWQEYDAEVYEAQSKLLETEIGLQAWIERSQALSDISETTGTIFTELEAYEEHDAITAKWKNYAQLYSLHYADGTMKEGEDLLRAKALNNHRTLTSKYYKYIDIKGSFDTALQSFEDGIDSEPTKLSPEERSTKIMDWVMKNTMPGLTEEYHEDLAKTFRRLEEFNKKLPKDIAAKLALSEDFNKITSLLIGYKDEFGQPNAQDMPQEKLDEIKRLQENINEAEKELIRTGFLSTVDKDLLIERSAIFQDLARLRGKTPTSYYIDVINEHMIAIGEPLVDEDTVNDLLRRKGDEGAISIETLLEKSIKLRSWFEQNHVKKYYKDKETGKMIYKYQRTSAWTAVEPSSKDYKLNTTLRFNDGSTQVLEGRTPTIKYKTKVVKDQYRTIPWGTTAEEKEKLIGVKIDNKGNFLPKNRDQLQAEGKPLDSDYINQDYYTLREQRPDHFQLLEKLKAYHLSNQKGIDYKSRLYLDMPRFRIGNQRLDDQEQWESGMYWDEKKKSWEKIKAGVKATLRGASREEANELSYESGDYELGLSTPEADEMDPIELMDSISADSVIDRVPIQGTSNMPAEDVSWNVLKALNVYMMSAEKQRIFTEINPLAKAILNTLHNAENNIKPDGIDKGTINYQVARRLKHDSFKDQNLRAATMKALYDREFKGKIYTEKHLDWVNKVTGKLMKGASFNYFALNLPSAVKNYWGALWQMNMEAIAGEHMDIASYAKAKVWTESAKMNWFNHIYGGDNYSLSNQMIMHFDPSEGKMEEVFGEHGTRTKKGDILSLSWFYSPRKYMEFEAALQLFGGMMYHKKISQTINGKTHDIPYMKAFELDDRNNMVLKPGIDKKYDIGGKEYLAFKNLMHEKAKDMNGAFSKFEQPQAQAHFAYRLVMFMRRYFTTMFMNRFGKKRASIITNDTKTGFYIESVKTIGKIIGSYGQYINLMEDSEKVAVKKIAAEVGQIMAVSAIVALLFGYDDDDPEKFAKMEARSGAIGSDDFNLPGFLANHLLVMLLKTSNENETFIPLPGFGLNDYTRMTSVTSVAFGPTITAYGKILTDIAMHAQPGEDPSLYYKRDQGPYPWQKEESAKIWAHIGSMFGVTGSDVDIVKGARSFDAVSNKWN